MPDFTLLALAYPTTQEAVLLAVVARLRDEISEFSNEATCFISDTTWPSVEISEELFCTVCPLDSSFDTEPPIGAGQDGIVENGVIAVTVWSRLCLDQLERTSIVLTHEPRGLLKLKHKVLKALAGRPLYADAPTNSVQLLHEYLRPMQARHPASRQSESDFSSFTLQFASTFEWELSG